MGLIRMGAPTDLILELQRAFNVKTFVETGTYQGETSAWAAAHFTQVMTVEFAQSFYEKAQQRFQALPQVRVIFGHSGVELGKLLPELNEEAIFWLDSHWSGGETYGAEDECPLMAELQAIVASSYEHYIFVDDARLFLSSPPQPHNPVVWPLIGDIVGILQNAPHKYEIFVIEDNIIAVPPSAKTLLTTYCQRVNTEVWQRFGEETKQNRVIRGTKMAGQGLYLVSRAIYEKATGWLVPSHK